MSVPLLISVREAAQLLGIGRDSAYALVRERRLPTIRIGRRLLVPRGALERWVEREMTGSGNG
jgi:excisionase family DNA binding protein